MNEFDSELCNLVIAEPLVHLREATLYVDGLPKSIGEFRLQGENSVFFPTPSVLLDIFPNCHISLKAEDTNEIIDCREFADCQSAPLYHYHFQEVKK